MPPTLAIAMLSSPGFALARSIISRIERTGTCGLAACEGECADDRARIAHLRERVDGIGCNDGEKKQSERLVHGSLRWL